MNLLEKLKETAVSVLPVMLIVILLGLTLAPLPGIMLGRFVLGGVMIILGLTVFLAGVDLGIQPMGERIGAELTKKRKLWLLLLSAFFIGFLVTAAEPDIHVFGSQVVTVFPAVSKNLFVFVIAGGVGVFLLLGLLRSVLNFSVKITFLVLYVLLFALVFFVPESFIGVAFDAGGATTGPMTVPFILALGLGVSSVRREDKESFGLTGVTSVGPVLAVLVYSVFLYAKLSGSGTAEISGAEEMASDLAAAAGKSLNENLWFSFSQVIPGVLKESLFSLLPLVFLFVVFQSFLLKMTVRQTARILIGLAYSLLGLFIFLVGVNGGFIETGRQLGIILGLKAFYSGGIWFALLVGTGLVLGAIVVCAEPAVWVLTEQVEAVTGGTIKRKVLLVFLSVGAAVAIGLTMIRAVYGFSIKWILVPGYALSLLLMAFCPSMFTGIAFDSGGVASGPITSTFVLSFALGASSFSGNSQDVFGVIALVAMTPLIAIQILGIIYKIKTRPRKGTEQEAK